ncbi:3-deoxy-7-phosphoheptulonate synthase [Streptomyces sp. NPDC056486]|uniref:3-deoxy-7-phosphoheptulonate synthase n=1 Tax=Streptomyces sp. NPDC056486 TaxID=3345835 RepID=UPI0036CDA0B5
MDSIGAGVGTGAAQQPDWPEPEELRAVTGRLAKAQPLVHAEECDRLRERLAAVARGEALLLQGGDCAETFGGVTAKEVHGKLEVLRDMSGVLSRGTGLPVVRVGRMAGQFAKPRSSAVEHRDGVTLPSYRGDAVNGLEFTEAGRRPDPHRMERMYEASAATLGLLRAHAHGAPEGPQEFFVSHEALLIDYEHSLTRTDALTGARYGTSGHLLWVGERTRQPEGAHLDFLSRVRNPVAVKLGPTTQTDDVLRYIERLDPDREAGRLTFVVRAGADRVRDVLPALVEKARTEGALVGWVSDPMHGNTFTAPSGHKTRSFDVILDEIRGFVEVHRALGAHPGGIHLELTGEDVTECVGGAEPVHLDALPHRYTTACDPRLNHRQARDLASRVAELYERPRARAKPALNEVQTPH